MTLIDALTRTDDDKRLFAQEEAILDFTELVCEIMDREGVSRSELASRLGKTKGYVSQLLAGETNMTIRTMSDLMHALGFVLRVNSSSPAPDVTLRRSLPALTLPGQRSAANRPAASKAVPKAKQKVGRKK